MTYNYEVSCPWALLRVAKNGAVVISTGLLSVDCCFRWFFSSQSEHKPLKVWVPRSSRSGVMLDSYTCVGYFTNVLDFDMICSLFYAAGVRSQWVRATYEKQLICYLTCGRFRRPMEMLLNAWHTISWKLWSVSSEFRTRTSAVNYLNRNVSKGIACLVTWPPPTVYNESGCS